MCKQSTQHVSQIANVLGQLLLEGIHISFSIIDSILDDALGLDAVKRSFVALLNIDIKGINFDKRV